MRWSRDPLFFHHLFSKQLLYFYPPSHVLTTPLAAKGFRWSPALLCLSFSPFPLFSLPHPSNLPLPHLFSTLHISIHLLVWICWAVKSSSHNRWVSAFVNVHSIFFSFLKPGGCVSGHWWPTCFMYDGRFEVMMHAFPGKGEGTEGEKKREDTSKI